MKNIIFLFILFTTFSITSCKKDNPTAEVDQEELSGAKLQFTAVEKEEKDGKVTYVPVKDEEVQEISFSGTNMAPPVGAHMHLELGRTYKLALTSFDFMGRESQKTFLDRAENHQAFLLGAPQGSLSFEYGEPQNVGVTAYITIEKTAPTFVLRYVIRHLNNGVKQNIKASDWNNVNFANFTGSNDLDLKFEVHLVEEGDHHD